MEPVRRPFEGVPGLPQSTEKSLSEIVQAGRFGSRIITLTLLLILLFYMHHCLLNLYAFPDGNEAPLYVTGNLSLRWYSNFMPFCTSQLNINDSV